MKNMKIDQGSTKKSKKEEDIIRWKRKTAKDVCKKYNKYRLD
jgi:hypothetical protein